MKNKILVFVLFCTTISLICSCTKQNSYDKGVNDLILKYHLSMAKDDSNFSATFNSIQDAESYLKSRNIKHVETISTKVDQYIAKSKIDNFVFNSKDVPKIYNKLENDVTKKVISFDNENAYFGCHNPYFEFEDRWSNLDYDGGTDMRLGYNYQTDGMGNLKQITLVHDPYGSMPTSEIKFSNERTIVNGDDIRTTFTSTQSVTIKIKGFPIVSTTISEWTIELNTCSHTKNVSVITLG